MSSVLESVNLTKNVLVIFWQDIIRFLLIFSYSAYKLLVNCIILKYFCLKQKHLKIVLFYALIKKINGVGEKKPFSQTIFVCDDTSGFKDVFTGKQDKILIKKNIFM